MATLECLKQALQQKANRTTTQPLSDAEYRLGFDILARGSDAYEDFINPQLRQVLTPLFLSRTRISVLEIGPGPKSVLRSLPVVMKQKIKHYEAFEPNGLHASSLERYIDNPSEPKLSLPHLEGDPKIHRVPFALDSQTDKGPGGTSDGDGGYDLILFCHSMYGMKPHHEYIQHALKMLNEEREGSMVVVFHRYGALNLAGLVCHQAAIFPGGTVRVADDYQVLDQFASFIAGFSVKGLDIDETVRSDWRDVCRTLGRPEEGSSTNRWFSAPEIMMTFTKHATALAELNEHVPLLEYSKRTTAKNPEARLRSPAAIVQPTKIEHIQYCVQWALKHRTGLTVLGGSHSSHCFWPSVVSVDMRAFNQMRIFAIAGNQPHVFRFLMFVGAGCKTEDVIRKANAGGLTVPLGARPSVGAGLWLQGGIGHQARLYGLACDAIVGAVLVSVNSSQILLIGEVPVEHQPVGAERPENEADEADLLWAIKGAGTNFGIVIGVTFKTFASQDFLTRKAVFQLKNSLDAKSKLKSFGKSIKGLPRDSSADTYLYWEAGCLRLGVIMFDSAPEGELELTAKPSQNTLSLGPLKDPKFVDDVGLFEEEMYMSGMHDGHGGGKTSAFKRCLFLKDIGSKKVSNILVAAIEARPGPRCYIHLLQGGEAVSDVTADATAFGCRDWNFACVITGVWPRNEDGTEIALEAVQWVYDVVTDLLPLSAGAYGANLGPDPRDATLAAKAFGPNRSRLARIKSKLDSHKVLAYACPLPEGLKEPKFIILTTGKSCAGKDYCAKIWAKMCHVLTIFTAGIVSISHETKRAYAAISGADFHRLLNDRAYKEQHRSKLAAFFEEQVHQRPEIRVEHFLDVVRDAADVDILFITGMRDEAPVATLSHLVPSSKLIDIRVQADEKTRRARRGVQGKVRDNDNDGEKESEDGDKDNNYSPSFIFTNNRTGDKQTMKFARNKLLPYFDEFLERLANHVVRVTPNFPRQGINFRHVLEISQQPGGLRTCIELLRNCYRGNWDTVAAVVGCEAGGFIFAAPLAARNNIPMTLIRQAGKLPPPTISVVTAPSNVSSSFSNTSNEKRFEMGRDAVPKGCQVVVVDDVLATGETICAVLKLLVMAGVDVKHITVMVIAEFPVHSGRYMLRERGFGKVAIQSLLVYGDA
ncbi:hypothetical protein F5Y07DRAFT_410177 [Xylaria sp. FL0933]|nr:hypothetical protein F5Y07DRAFT_410177 [Xylaria sp. FL0933]